MCVFHCVFSSLSKHSDTPLVGAKDDCSINDNVVAKSWRLVLFANLIRFANKIPLRASNESFRLNIFNQCISYARHIESRLKCEQCHILVTSLHRHNNPLFVFVIFNINAPHHGRMAWILHKDLINNL